MIAYRLTTKIFIRLLNAPVVKFQQQNIIYLVYINRLDEKTRSTSNIFLSRLQINPMICHNHFLSAIQKYSRLCNVLELFLVLDFYIMTKLLQYKKSSMMFFGQNVNPLTNEEIFFGLKMEFVVKKQTQGCHQGSNMVH